MAVMADKYNINKFLLRFELAEKEEEYRKSTIRRTLNFCRIAWGLVIFLGISFAFLDRQEFGTMGDTVTLVRMVLILFAALVLGATFNSRALRYLHLSSALFITSTGAFCIYLVAMCDPAAFTPYFTGLFFAYAGIFVTAGLGFTYNLSALTLNVIAFEIVIGLVTPVPLRLFLVYTFFLVGFAMIFAYISYMLELILRKNFAMTASLQDSLAEIKTLSGLLPICSNCKKIRDDRGYWNQIDEYFRDHSDVDFSHSLCPDCIAIFYPKLKISGKK